MKKYSQIRAMLSITRASFRSSTRSPSAVVFTLAFPLIFILVFGFIGNRGGVKVNVAFDSTSDTLNAIYKVMSNNPMMRLSADSDSEIVKALKKGDLDGIIHIERRDSGFVVKVATSDVSIQGSQMLKGMVKQIVDEMNLSVMPNLALPFSMMGQCG